jgi:eukaryotic-like serine/threonine-protein kinase
VEDGEDNASSESTDSDASDSEDKLLAELAFAPEVTPHSAILGTRVGRYLIESVLGRGGMGVVFRARDTVLDREVALKLVPPELLVEPERRARFVREGRSAAAATHANIAAVYDVGEIDGQVFLAMELVEGETLRSLIRREALSADDAIVVARGMARGLAKAHEKGIIHRDLKPDNVMVGEALHVKLLDFGLAKLREVDVVGGGASMPRTPEGTLTFDGRVLGTPAYMSPEQAKGKEVDHRTDIFSFGVVFYEMLAGERPFRGDSAIEILSAVMRDTPAPLSENVSEDIREIVARCLEKDLSKRYASAKELLAALDGVWPNSQYPKPPPSANLLRPESNGLPSGDGSSPSSLRAAARVAELSRSIPPPPRARRVGIALAVAAVLLGGVMVVRARLRPIPPAITNAASRAARVEGRAVTDHARPRSHNPEALAAYGSGLQNFRDGSIAFAAHEFERAGMLDPELAAAHLRVMLISSFKLDTTHVREHFAAASQYRRSLDERDAAMLQASEELIRERPNHIARARAMEAVRERYPDDAEVAWMTANVLGSAGRTEEAKVAIRRARELDPQFAAALWFESSLLEDEQTDTSLKLLDECLRISPSAASCLRVRSGIRAARGDCAGYEADARRMTEIEPRGPRAYEYLAAALAARGAPLESVKAALDKRASLGVTGTGDSPAEMRAQADLWVALLAGDFVTAETAATALDRLNDHDASEMAHVVPALTLIDIYEERGEADRALGVAESFVRRLPAWTANAPTGVRARLVMLRRRAGLLDEAKAQAQRDELLRESMEMAFDGDPKKGIYFWLAIEAQYVTTRTEAKAALVRLPTVADAGAHVRGFDDWARGKVELLAGHTKEASKSLGAALATCTAMPTTDTAFLRVPFSWAEAQLLLGESLEETDRPGACDAYARVIDRWKDAKPRSVSVEKARSRARARGCVHS